MNGGAGRVLAGALIDAVAEADPVRTARVMDQLAGLRGPGWLRLDELARRPYWGQPPLDAVAGWLPLLAADDALAGVAASMCRDGRIREVAVKLLAGRRAPVAAAALAVRVADWVPEVSSAAWAAVSARTGPEDAAAIIPVFLALGQRRRGRQAAARYLEGIAEGPAATLAALAAAEDRACRLWALQAQADRGLLTVEVLAAWAMRDRDPVVALWCARSLAGPAGELPVLAGLRLLGSARAGVRAFAAGHLRDDQLTRQALQELLLDRSGAVRSMARWRWRRQWRDPGPVYRSVLAGPGLARQIAAALQGLDEDHADCLPGAAVPFLVHHSPRVRRAAAQAVGRHASTDGILEHLVPLLLDSSGKVAAAALRYVRGHAVPASVLASLDAASTFRSRRVALSIRQGAGTWDRIHADLTALSGQDPDLAEAARTDLLAWLQHGAATSYGKPSASQAADIARLLATPKLSNRQRREIAFVAGIREPSPP
jgi:hypothetical protein